MRKLTGYIGALIIVFALMGSIFAGYALNINGSSSVINKYERVTDVSGLYSHTQEPSYIEYNPASNYIGYVLDNVSYNNPSENTYTFRQVNNNTIVINHQNKEVSIDGNSQGIINGIYAFICDNFYIFFNQGDCCVYTHSNGFVVATTNVTINTNPGNLTLNVNDLSLNYNNIKYAVCYCSNGATHYLKSNGSIELYLNSGNELFSILVGNWGSTAPGLGISNTVYDLATGTYTTVDLITNLGNVASGVNRYHTGYNTNVGAIVYPISVMTTAGVGINYTESSRVNNYPIETDYVNTGQIITSPVNLMSVSATDYWTSGRTYVYENTHYFGPGESYKYIRYMPGTIAGHSYRLSDITDIEIIGETANYVRIDAPVTFTDYSFTDNDIFGDYDPYTINFRAPSGNWAVLAPFANVGQQTVLDFNSLANQYVYYFPDTGKCELYNSAGVKQGTYDNLDQLYVIFVDTETLQNDIEIYKVDNLYSGTYSYESWNPIKSAPFINLTYETGGIVSTVHYADITKGFSIKNDNVNNVIWDNEYDNGNIQLLFRADNVLGTYHNGIIIGDNEITIDYYSNHYFISLNGAAPVDIGRWRNISLNVDLRSGELSAIPVRTFNSYTNVELDTASIFIGDLTNPAPTNIIEWEPTANSLKFNVYSTAVFMNTYGVIMVNPSLNITDYFTNLDNFYRLNLYNFGVYGDSITVNGVTGNITNNTLTINDQSIQLKDMAITYADGHAYISDSNVNIDLGTITDNNISMTGNWYFETDLLSGYTNQKMVYEWDWGDFILNNTQFCIMYMGIALIGLIVARRYCTMSITDYIVLMTSFIIALTVQVIA